jgi:hypothetical protein
MVKAIAAAASRKSSGDKDDVLDLQSVWRVAGAGLPVIAGRGGLPITRNAQTVGAISAGDDLKLMILNNSSVAYLNVSAERINMPRDERAVIWVRGQIEKNIVRIPPLPPAWISGQGEFMPPKTGGERMAVDRMSNDEPVRAAASARLVNDENGHAGNGGVSITSPLPKRASEYQLPEGTSLDEAESLLSRKLEEARVIIRELEKRTGLRLTLSRNFQIVVDLSSR